MAETAMKLTDEQHEQCARALFNATWDLLSKETRNEVETDLMIHRCHAMWLHWSMVGTPRNFARAEWQLARVYAVAGRPAAAIHHASLCLRLCQEHDLGAFDTGFAYEALARAHGVAGDTEQAAEFKGLAAVEAERLAEGDDRTYLLDDLATI